METGKLTVKEYLGTGKIAKLFGVAPRTVAKWIDKELLVGTRIPGSKHRRVALSEVIRFAEKHNMAFVDDEEEKLAEDVIQPEPAFAGHVCDPDEDEGLVAVSDDILGRKEV